MFPLAVDAIVVCSVSVELSDLDLGCDVVGGGVLGCVFAPCVGLWFGDAWDHVPDELVGDVEHLDGFAECVYCLAEGSRVGVFPFGEEVEVGGVVLASFGG